MRTYSTCHVPSSETGRRSARPPRVAAGLGAVAGAVKYPFGLRFAPTSTRYGSRQPAPDAAQGEWDWEARTSDSVVSGLSRAVCVC